MFLDIVFFILPRNYNLDRLKKSTWVHRKTNDFSA